LGVIAREMNLNYEKRFLQGYEVFTFLFTVFLTAFSSYLEDGDCANVYQKSFVKKMIGF